MTDINFRPASQISVPEKLFLTTSLCKLIEAVNHEVDPEEDRLVADIVSSAFMRSYTRDAL